MILRTLVILASAFSVVSCSSSGMTYTQQDLEMARRYGNNVQILSQEDKYWRNAYYGEPESACDSGHSTWGAYTACDSPRRHHRSTCD